VAKNLNVNSVERALAVLELLDSARRALNVSEISRKLDVPKSTAHVIVLTLERLGYVVRDPLTHGCTLGLKVYSLGREMMQNMSLPDQALPHMRWLVERTKLTAHLAVLEKNQAIYVQKVDGPSLIRFDTFIGKRTGLHSTGVGKVLLAYAPKLFRNEFLRKTTFARYTAKTITSASALRKALDKITMQGYAVDDQEEELEVRCVAAPVFNQAGEPAAALSLTGTIGQVNADNIEGIVSLLKQAAERICRSLDMPAPPVEGGA
jgi:DNA-binding IclR family transcriptional regulator